MRVQFEFEIHLPNVSQRIREIICIFKGHQFENYVEPESFWGEDLSLRMFRAPTIDKKCNRCGELIYKPKKKERKPKTIQFSRYSDLKQIKKHAK